MFDFRDRHPPHPSSSPDQSTRALLAEMSRLEAQKNALAARQADLTARLLPRLAPEDRLADRVARARAVSPRRGRALVRLARALSEDLPHTRAAFRSGILSEHRVELIAAETGLIAPGLRRVADAELWAETGALAGAGNRRVSDRARAVAVRLDSGATARRGIRAVDDRGVTGRPAADGMLRLSATLPASAGVAVLAALTSAVDSAQAAGDPRVPGQVMADALVARVTGHPSVDTIPFVLNVVLTERTLIEGSGEPAILIGYGSLPAETIIDLGQAEHLWLRRLFTHPSSGELMEATSRSRVGPVALRTLVELRDQQCRTPHCDDPIRHIDRMIGVVRADPASPGEPVALAGLRGLCDTCHQAEVQDVTSRPPPLPGIPPR